MSFSIIEGTLASAVATAGTFTAGYPSGKNPGSFFLAMGHKITINGDAYFFPVDFDVAFGASSITVTNKHTATWPASAKFRLQMEEQGDRAQITVPMQSPNSAVETVSGSSYSINVRPKLVASVTECYVDLLNLGAPIAADPNGICESQSVSAGVALTLNGVLASSGAVTLDVPRALSVDSGGADTAVLTVVGTDVYGRAMSEAITLNGTTQVNGKKAFKTISSVTASGANISNGAFVGTTDILGLPIFVPSDGFVVSEMRDGHPVGNPGTQTVQFAFTQTDLLAGTAQSFISPVTGFITGAKAIVNKNTVATGGNIAIKVGTTDVTGLTLVVADGSAPGTVVSDTPTTPFSSTTAVSVGSRIQVAPDASFNTSGDINGYVEVTGVGGVLVAGIRTAGGSTTTTGDVRGTYTPAIACDGAAVIQLVLAYPDRYAGIAQNVSGA